MRNNQTKKIKPLKVRGTRVPRLLIWMRGFLHGKIFRSAGQDPETHTITSAYLAGQTHRFRKACIHRVARAEQKLKGFWTEADELLIDLASIRTKLDSKASTIPVSSEDHDQLRAQERAEQSRASLQSKYQSSLKRLSFIKNMISSELLTVRNQMECTSELLLSTFTAYGHGLLLKPVGNSILPELSFDEFVVRYWQSHEDTLNAILKNTKEALS